VIILGVDPGIATTGVGIIEKQGSKLLLKHYGAILTPPHLPLEERLALLYHHLRLLIQQFSPKTMAVESLFFSNNAKTVMQVGQARGVILLAGQHEKLTVHSYTPLQVKSGICGHGQADKNQVQYMVMKLLSLQEKPRPDDAADALAIAICHSHLLRIKSLT
jgi:crossover junction endodeoxyribonuclease RuvC